MHEIVIKYERNCTIEVVSMELETHSFELEVLDM